MNSYLRGIHTVIGAAGNMGQFLVNVLLADTLENIEIVQVDKESSPESWQKARQADVIWLCIPRDAVDGVVANQKLLPHQLVIDVCSVKRDVAAVIARTGAGHLSLHPLQGPGVPLSGQKWVVIPTPASQFPHTRADEVLKFLQAMDIKLFQAESSEQHDIMMGIMLGMTSLMSVVVDMLIDQYIHDNGISNLSNRSELMRWTTPAFHALFSACTHNIVSNAPWLRKDMLLGAHGNLFVSAQAVFQKLAQSSEVDITQHFESQQRSVSNLQSPEKERIRKHIETWFAETTKTMFIC